MCVILIGIGADFAPEMVRLASKLRRDKIAS